MKRRLLYIIAAAMLLQAAVSSCKKDDEDMAVMILTVNDNSNVLEFSITGYGTAFIDWGDGLPFDTITLPVSKAIVCKHHYSVAMNREIRIYGDDIQSLKFDGFPWGSYFIKLTDLDVSKNKALTSLYCQDNLLTDLDVSKNKALTT